MTSTAERLGAVLFTVLLTSAMFVGFVTIPAGTVSASTTYAGGDGSADNPYQIANWDHLDRVGLNLDANFVLVNDLNSSTAGYDSVANGSANTGAGFEPIGEFPNSEFTGSFDGAGYTIADLVIDRSDENSTGLFGAADSNAEISNTTLKQITVTGKHQVGGLVGITVGGNVTVHDSNVTGRVNGSNDVGGLIGESQGPVERSTAAVDVDATGNGAGGLTGQNNEFISNSTATGDVNGSKFVGGLTGDNTGSVLNSTATGNVSGGNMTGGLVGVNGIGGIVDLSSAQGAVDGETEVGGLVGLSGGAGETVLTRSYATGNVTGTSNAEGIGGLVGVNSGGVINRSYATGVVSGTGEGAYGGLVGKLKGHTIVNETYSNGLVTTSTASTGPFSGPAIGGLVGEVDRTTVTHSYWDTDTSNQPASVVGDGLTTAEMTGSDALTNLAGFDPSVWQTNSGTGGTSQYPILQANAQTPPPGVTVEPGTEANPYRIANWSDLDDIRNDLSATYTLVADLNASTDGYDSVANASANGGAGFDPIGKSGSGFTGSFDGAGYTIEHLVINRSSEHYVGLFGYADTNAEMSDVALSQMNVTGNDTVGGLVGFNAGSISNSTATGTVTGSNRVGGLIGNSNGQVELSNATATVTGSDEIGGLVGYTSGGTVALSSAHGDVVGENDVGGLVGHNTDDISRSYATGNVTGKPAASNGVGGLVGKVGSRVEKSYATGVVSGTGTGAIGGLAGYQNSGVIYMTYSTSLINSTSQNTGGLIGTKNTGAVTDSYWDTTTSNQSTSAAGTNLTTAEMTGSNALTSLSGFDASVWQANSGGTPGTAQYPTLQANPQTPPPGVTVEPGTEANPYRIANWTDLDDIRNDLSANYTLVTDLNASTPGYNDVAGPTANNGSGFAPIGDISNQFTGSFDGAGHTITGLTIDRPSADDDVGLFGTMATDGSATVENVAFVDVNVTGKDYVGALAGQGYGVISDVTVSGTVNGTSTVGGVVGYYASGATRGQLSNVTVNATVTGGNYVGGAAGYADGDVFDVVTSGDITGDDYVGGLAGYSGYYFLNESFSNVTATGDISGRDYVGGLVAVGRINMSNVSATGDVSGRTYVGGLVGDARSTTVRTIGNISAATAIGDVNGTTYVGGLIGSVTRNGSVADAYATGTVSGTDSVGGLVGNVTDNGTVSTSYAIGNTTGTTDVGGLVGTVTGDGSVTDAYWDLNTTGRPKSPAGTGLTTAEMTGSNALGNMSGFDATVWKANPSTAIGPVYPTLQSNPQTPPPQQSIFAGGDGTETTPYEISDWTQFDDVRVAPSANYTLTADLNNSTDGYDSVANASANDGAGFEPIGNESTDTPFEGSFDGNGHTISDFVIDRDADNIGLFGYVNGSATLSDLSLANVSVTGDHAVGGLVGRYNSSEPITDASVSGAVDATGNSSGGLVGSLEAGNVTNASADVDVSGRFRTGGLIGYASGPNEATIISGSVANGDVNSESGPAGGLMGTVDGKLVEVSDSRATGNVTVTPGTLRSGNPATGGLIGYVPFAKRIENASASGTVDGNDGVGGLVGYLGRNGALVFNSSASGDVSGTNDVGGLIGENNRVVQLSYATGAVFGSEKVGGLVGTNDDEIAASYATGDVSGSDHVGGLAGTSSDLGEIIASYATGSVDGTVEVGGLVGTNNNNVRTSYATGSVNGEKSVGGLAGLTKSGSTIENSYAIGQVTGNKPFGGLVGDAGPVSVSISSSYWDTEATGQGESAGSAIGLTTEQMTGGSANTSMSDLDFDEVWDVVDDGSFVSYPFLQSNSQDPAPGKTAVSSGSNGNSSGGSSSGGSSGGSSTVSVDSVTEPGDDTESEAATDNEDASEAESYRWAVAIRNAGTGERIDIALSPPADGEQSTTTTPGAGEETGETTQSVQRNVLPDGLEIRFKRGGDYDLEVSSRDVDVFDRSQQTSSDDESSGTSTPDLSVDALDDDGKRFVSETNQRPVGFIEVDTNFDSSDVVQEATHRFRVRKSYLEATGASVDSVQLYRDEIESWRPLPTRQVNEDETFYYFEAETPGFSVFAIGTSAPVFETSEPRLVNFDNTSGSVEATLTVDNVGNESGIFDAALTADGTTIGTANVTVPAGETVNVSVNGTVEGIDSAVLTLAGQSAGTVTPTEPTPERTTTEPTPEPTATELTPERTTTEPTPEPTATELTPERTEPEPESSGAMLVGVIIGLLVIATLGVLLWRRRSTAEEQ